MEVYAIVSKKSQKGQREIAVNKPGANAKRLKYFGRLLDFSLYILIAIALVVGVILQGDDLSGPRDQRLHWAYFGGFTVLTFAYPLGKLVLHWRKTRFWVVLCALLAAHSAAWAVFLEWWFTRAKVFPIEYWLFAFILETPALGLLLHVTCGPGYQRSVNNDSYGPFD